MFISEDQAFELARNVLAEYELRTGGAPLRVVLHKTSYFDAAERAGFAEALKDIPIVSMVTLVPSLFRLCDTAPIRQRLARSVRSMPREASIFHPALCQSSALIPARMFRNLLKCGVLDLRHRSQLRRMFST